MIVVGGGPVGLALARAARGLKVALVAPHAPPPPRGVSDAFDARVYALSPANVAFLQSLRAWQALPAPRLTPVHAMRIFGDAPGAELVFDAYRAGVPELAWTVEDGLLQDALWHAVREAGEAELFAPAECAKLRPGRPSVLELADGRRLSGALVAGADGARSAVRVHAGIEARESEYGQAGLVANFACAKPHENTAYQWFLGGPVLALLPLPERRVSMVWALPAAEAARMLSLAPEALCREVEAASRGTLGALEPLTPARSYPLRRLQARRLAAPGVALLGDAAHVIHPLAGQGLNLGLQDAQCLAGLLAAREAIRDPGDERLLRRYERSRAEPILAMDSVVDGLFRLFGSGGAAAVRLRNAGLNLTDRMPVIKNLLMRHAMR